MTTFELGVTVGLQRDPILKVLSECKILHNLAFLLHILHILHILQILHFMHILHILHIVYFAYFGYPAYFAYFAYIMSKDYFISSRELGAAYTCGELLCPLRWNCCSLLL